MVDRSFDSNASACAKRLSSKAATSEEAKRRPAWLFSILSNLDIHDGYRGQNEFFRSLLGFPGTGY